MRRPPATPAQRASLEAAYASTKLPGGRTPWRSAAFCVVDLELTGLDVRSDEIISYGAVPIDGGRVDAGRVSYGLVRPRRPPSEASVLIHGIRTVDLEEAPPLETALWPLVEALTGRLIVAHAAAVEEAFLSVAFASMGLGLHTPLIDTDALGRLLMAERGEIPPRFLPLGEIAAYFGLPVHRPHHALGDALTTAQAFLALASHLEVRGSGSVRSLASATDRLRWMRR